MEHSFHHLTDRQLLELVLENLMSLDTDVQAATTVITELVALVGTQSSQIADLQAQLAAAGTVPQADEDALNAAVAAGTAVLTPPPPPPVPEALSVPSVDASFALGTAASFQVVSSGGTPPVTFTVDSLPSGLSMDGNGLISGTPDTTGTTSSTVTATDSTGATAEGTVAITVA